MKLRMSSQRCLLLFAVLFLVITPVQASDANRFAKGILWEISTKGKQPSYLLGTIHSDAPSVTTIPAPIQNTMSKVQSFTAELDLNLASIIEAQTQMLLPPDQDLKSIVGQQRYDKAVQLMLHYGMPEMIVARMKPWAIAAQLMMPKPTTGIFLDLKLFQQAQARGISTYGLETVAEQMGIFEKMSKQQQISMLDQSLREHKNMPAMIQQLTQLYLDRDLAGMQRVSEEQMKKGDQALAKLFEDSLINDRNLRMVERMAARLNEGHAFIAVGALHLPGEKGLLRLLQNRGYQLKALY